jgi:hypothetical protein
MAFFATGRRDRELCCDPTFLGSYSTHTVHDPAGSESIPRQHLTHLSQYANIGMY